MIKKRHKTQDRRTPPPHTHTQWRKGNTRRVTKGQMKQKRRGKSKPEREVRMAEIRVNVTETCTHRKLCNTEDWDYTQERK